MTGKSAFDRLCEAELAEFRGELEYADLQALKRGEYAGVVRRIVARRREEFWGFGVVWGAFFAVSLAFAGWLCRVGLLGAAIGLALWVWDVAREWDRYRSAQRAEATIGRLRTELAGSARAPVASGSDAA